MFQSFFFVFLNLLGIPLTFSYILNAHPLIPSLEKIKTEFNYKKQDETFWKKYLKGERLQVCRHRIHKLSEPGEYDNFYLKGIYYCACCGGDYPLFSSETKFDARTGWPTFYAAFEGAVTERPDPVSKIRLMLGFAKTEVICNRCGSHLGHVFQDGPSPSYKRYAIDSLALIFIPDAQEPKRTFEVQNEDLLSVIYNSP